MGEELLILAGMMAFGAIMGTIIYTIVLLVRQPRNDHKNNDIR